jgi:hypothetical protein
MNGELQVYEGAPPPMALSDVKAQVNLIQQIMREVMKSDEHYGVIPGTNGKPSLLKPGAEKLIMTFRFVPDVEEQIIELPNEHREVRVKVRLYTQNGIFLGAGVGSCTTMEGKYRYRTGPSELTDKPVPKGYWDLRKEDPAKAQSLIGGKGFTTKKDDSGKWVIAIQGDKVEHDNPADYYNTVLKMAKKRALVDACLTVTAASDIFTQDIEDMPEVIPGAAKTQDAKTKPPITQPKSKPPDAAPLTVRGVIEDVKIHSGTTKAGKDYTKYGVIIKGTTYGTFDTVIGESAQSCQGSEVVVSYTSDGKFSTIVELVPVLSGEAA